MIEDHYRALSEERKRLQREGLLPPWFTTGGWQLFKSKYSDKESPTFHHRARVIAQTAAKYTHEPERYVEVFFRIIWNGWLSCSTPILANMGTDKGMPVSCSGGYIEDSVEGFYEGRKETAILSKNGFGTSSYLGDIRPRGMAISRGGKASGVLPVLKGFVQDSQDITQGTQRRGAWAGYLPIDHGDFWELITYLENNPDDLNIGWIVNDEFVGRLEAGEDDALSRYKRALKVKMVTGKGYFSFIDKINRKSPEAYKRNNLQVRSSNLCNEITLFSDSDHTFTCVLASLNLSKYDEWKDTTLVEDAVYFLDCVAEDFIVKGSAVRGLERAVASTRKGRALGLGACGWHTLLQQKRISWESLEAGYLNDEIFRLIKERAVMASTHLATIHGEPDWCRGTGRRNTHLLAIAPTKSTALIMGGISEGINPDPGMTYTQSTAGGEINRINPVLLELMKEKGVFNSATLAELVAAQGSVQGVEWLSDEDKRVFKTAFEISQNHVLRHAKGRARYLDQWQSLNLFFSDQESEEYISSVHKQAFLDEDILGLYYVYSKAGVTASTGECIACQ
jgi:ribonucleoside-diphosphate reductase alpha chain